MGVSVHPITLQIRAGSRHKSYGDPYDIAVDMQLLGKDRAYLSCARGELTKEIYIEIGEKLREMGITVVEWERRTGACAKIIRTLEKL